VIDGPAVAGAMFSGPLAAVLLALLLLAAAYAIGAQMLRWLGAELRALETLLFATVLGVGVLGSVYLGLAAIGWLQVSVLWGVALVPAALARESWRALPRLLREVKQTLHPEGPVERIVLMVSLVVLPLILVLGALGPINDWDSLMYHLELPKTFLEAGRLFVPPDGLHVAYLGLFQFLYLPLLAVGATAAPAVLNALLAMGLALALLAAGERLFSRTTGVGAFLALWGSSSVALVATTARIDVTLMLVLFLTHHAVLIALVERAAWAVRLAAVLAGVAIAMKYHALPYLGVLAPFAVYALWRQADGRFTARVVREAGLGAALALVIALPWFLKNQVFFGAPLYPFLAERVVPPFIADIQGTTAHPENVSREIYRALGRARESVSLKALLLNPSSLTVEGEALAYTRNPVLYLVPLVLLFVRDRVMLALLLPSLGYLAFALGPFAKTNLRYLMPAIPAVALVTVEALRRIAERLPQPARMRQVLVGLVALAALPALRVDFDRLVYGTRVRAALGMVSTDEFLGRETHYVVARWFNQAATPEKKMLMLFDARGFYWNRTTIQDNVLTNWPLLVGTGATDRCLAGTGITHVYVNQAIASYYRYRGLDLTLLSWDRFPEFAGRCLELITRTGGVEVYRVRR